MKSKHLLSFFTVPINFIGVGNNYLCGFIWKKKDPQTFISYLRQAVSKLKDISYP